MSQPNANVVASSRLPAMSYSPVDVPLDDDMLATGNSGSSNQHIDFPSSSSSEAAGRALAIDHIQVMLRKESTAYACIQPYTGVEKKKKDTVEEAWRRRICEWAFEVTDHYCYDREVTSIALYYLDRFVSYTIAAGETVGRKDFQLLAITCLYVAMKLHGSIDLNLTQKRVRIPLSQFVELSRGHFSAELIEKMEMKLLRYVLNWHLNPPTSAQFMADILQLLIPSLQGDAYRAEVTYSKLFDVTRFLTETGVCASSVFVAHSPSVIALAALANAVEAADDATLSPYERQDLFSKLSEIAFYFKADVQAIHRVRTLLTELCPDVQSLYLCDEDDANDGDTDAADPLRRSSNRSVSGSDSESSSGKRSPDCVARGANEICKHPSKRRVLE
mmetsp:Transcript_10461/g.22717  ORF Transcript_10461/g.22717 Transcript_10461/m.22717 type:complete len:389 (-) Transcript_10461:264-1430(-)